MGKMRLNCEFDGIDVQVCFSIHSLDRSQERYVDPYDVLITLDKAGETLFAGKVDETLVIRDFERNVAVVYNVDSLDGEMVLDIITVYSDAKAFRQHPDQRIIVIRDGQTSGPMSLAEYKQLSVLKAV